MNKKKKQAGFGLVGWIIATPFILLGLLIFFAIGYFIYCEANKAYWDKKIAQMCEKDGGIHIYEKIILTKGELKKINNKEGKISIPLEGLAAKNAPVYWESKVSTIKRGHPKILRRDVKIIRQKDQKTIAKYTRYIRIGGDFPFIIVSSSSFSCPSSETLGVERQKLFIIREK